MARWVPPGLQHLVQSIQSAFINHSDGRVSSDALAEFLRDKRDQLHRAAQASRAVQVPHQGEGKPIAASNAITIDLPALAVA